MRLWTSHLTLWNLTVVMCKLGIAIHTFLGFAKIKGDDIYEKPLVNRKVLGVGKAFFR